MKFSVKPNQLKLLILGTGVLGFLLRVLLYATGTDGRGFLVRFHWAGICLWLLTLASAGALLLLPRPIRGPERYSDAFPVSWVSAAGAFAAAVGTFITTISIPAPFENAIAIVTTLLGYTAAAAFAWIGFCRLVGAKPYFLLPTVVCLYFALRMVAQYRHWSADPQLQDYLFYLCGCTALMLNAYQQAAFTIGIGSHRALWITGLAAIYLCAAGLYGCQDVPLMLTSIIWVFTNLTDLSDKPRRRRPPLTMDDGTGSVIP